MLKTQESLYCRKIATIAAIPEVKLLTLLCKGEFVEPVLNSKQWMASDSSQPVENYVKNYSDRSEIGSNILMWHCCSSTEETVNLNCSHERT